MDDSTADDTTTLEIIRAYQQWHGAGENMHDCLVFDAGYRAALAALTAERDRLREALRERVVTGMRCDLCSWEWRIRNGERHAPDCLAAPVSAKE